MDGLCFFYSINSFLALLIFSVFQIAANFYQELNQVLEAVLFHNRNKYPYISLGHLVHLKDETKRINKKSVGVGKRYYGKATNSKFL